MHSVLLCSARKFLPSLRRGCPSATLTDQLLRSPPRGAAGSQRLLLAEIPQGLGGFTEIHPSQPCCCPDWQGQSQASSSRCSQMPEPNPPEGLCPAPSPPRCSPPCCPKTPSSAPAGTRRAAAGTPLSRHPPRFLSPHQKKVLVPSSYTSDSVLRRGPGPSGCSSRAALPSAPPGPRRSPRLMAATAARARRGCAPRPRSAEGRGGERAGRAPAEVRGAARKRTAGREGGMEGGGRLPLSWRPEGGMAPSCPSGWFPHGQRTDIPGAVPLKGVCRTAHVALLPRALLSLSWLPPSPQEAVR